MSETPERIALGEVFTEYERRAVVDQIVLHESVTYTVEDAVRVLNAQGYGAHFLVDLDGSITKHAGLSKRVIHCAGSNHRGVGIEVINRYYGKYEREGDTVVKAVWAHKKQYIFPPVAQLKAVWWLVKWVSMRMDIPMEFPGTDPENGTFYWGRRKVGKIPGIMAHHRTHHADGLVPEHFCVASHAGLDPGTAYRLTMEMATAMKRKTDLPEPGEMDAA